MAKQKNRHGLLASIALATLLLSAVSGVSAGEERPLIPIPGSSMGLDQGWRFAVDPDNQGEALGWANPDFDDSDWQTVRVPHTWNVAEAHFDYEGHAWYRQRFSLPSVAANANLRLRFEAVFYLARVWLNGQYLGEHEGGYTPFEFDVTQAARLDGENVLVVQVDNLRSRERIPAQLTDTWSFDWWNYGGIVRPVSLILSTRAFIAGQRIVAVPHLTGEDTATSATVTSTVTVVNASSEAFDALLWGEFLDDATGADQLSQPVMVSLSLEPGESKQVELTATLDSPQLWHFDHPNLYRFRATLRRANLTPLHSHGDTFGVRSVELRDTRMYLNGEPVRLVGLTRHADSPRSGLAESITVMAADYNDLKTLNQVLSRPVHYPQAEYIMDYCDRNGILLIPEIPAWQLDAQQMTWQDMRTLAQQQLREMVETNFNHPSVWAWSVGNEIASDTAAGRSYVEEMVAYVKSLDPTRPVGFASNRLYGRQPRDATEFSDFVLMNQYVGTWGGEKRLLGEMLDQIHRTWPDKTVIISEFGFEPRWNQLTGQSASHLNPERFYFIPDEVPSDSEEADEQRRLVISDQMAVYRSRPFVAGAIFWTYQDYRTRTDFIMGVVDAERNRRGSWALLREEFSPVLLEGVTLSRAPGGNVSATVVLRTRGPVDEDMPAYTLRDYTLHWAVRAPDSDIFYAEGDVALPVLSPGSEWSGEIEWPVSEGGYELYLAVVRPTGFTAIERLYNAQGQEIAMGLERE